ncbi:hypothetical protein P691DRAFT_778777 [Macrolepiota fuliginosa MF-IS2]|uniref:DUF6534 domain-containing protein n=1 Tax=Macrolepiota fuliginosa MF-IS2 TaxID=1400762 RepID=A0A9P6BZN6_9AGAR|nr:hypothetical protein P691DRAFT_778777 [Macrolepiota fuliginosa MF-IS2]
MNLERNGDTLAAPFVGFAVGTALFGVTLLQSYQYFMQYGSKDHIFCKVKIAIVRHVRIEFLQDKAHLTSEFAHSLLDLLHFVFSANIMYTFLILNFGVADASTRNTWSLKALGTTQSALIVLVQIIYLGRINALSQKSLIYGDSSSVLIKAMIYIIGSCAIGVAIVFCYELQRIEVILSLNTKSEWVIYLGFGATAILDTIIAAMMCFVLYKNKLDIGAHISPQTDRVLSKLIMYVLATGLLTSFASILVIILYFARPDTLFYIAVTFSVTRLYTNSTLALMNLRRKLNDDLVDRRCSGPLSEIVFNNLTPAHMRTRCKRKTTHIGSLNVATRPHTRHLMSAITSSDSESDYDVEAQNRNLGTPNEVNLYSPYYSPLEARKQMGSLFPHSIVREPEEMNEGSWMSFWKAQKSMWFGWPIERRLTL